MKSIDLSEIAALTPHVQPGSRDPSFATKDGHAVAAIVPVGDDEIEDLLLSINQQFQEILQRLQHRLDTEGGVSSNAVRKQLGLP